MGKNKKKKIDVVYSTNQNFSYDYDDDMDEETLAPAEQLLYVSIDRKKRKGKSVTIVEGFIGTEVDLKELGKVLKSKCGVGGSAKEGEIMVQGELKDKVYDILVKEGFKVKKKGG